MRIIILIYCLRNGGGGGGLFTFKVLGKLKPKEIGFFFQI